MADLIESERISRVETERIRRSLDGEPKAMMSSSVLTPSALFALVRFWTASG